MTEFLYLPRSVEHDKSSLMLLQNTVEVGVGKLDDVVAHGEPEHEEQGKDGLHFVRDFLTISIRKSSNRIAENVLSSDQ